MASRAIETPDVGWQAGNGVPPAVEGSYWPLIFAFALVVASFPMFTLFRRIPHAGLHSSPNGHRLGGQGLRMPGAPLQITPCDPDAPFTPLATRRFFRMAHVGNLRHNGRRRLRKSTADGNVSETSSIASDEEFPDSSSWKLVLGKVERGEEPPWSGRSALKGGRSKDLQSGAQATDSPATPSPLAPPRLPPLTVTGLAPASPNLSPYPSPLLTPRTPQTPTLYPDDDADKRVRLEEPLASKASLVALRKTFLYSTSPAVVMRSHLGLPAPTPPEEDTSSESSEDEEEIVDGHAEVEHEEGEEEPEPSSSSAPPSLGAHKARPKRRPVRQKPAAAVHAHHRTVPTVRRRSSSRSGRPLSRPSNLPAGPSAGPSAASVTATVAALASSGSFKVYKRTPPSSRADRRRFLEQQSREAAQAASAAAVLIRMNGGRPPTSLQTPSQPLSSLSTAESGPSPVQSAIPLSGPPSIEEPDRKDALPFPSRGSSLHPAVTASLGLPPAYTDAVLDLGPTDPEPEPPVAGPSRATLEVPASAPDDGSSGESDDAWEDAVAGPSPQPSRSNSVRTPSPDPLRADYAPPTSVVPLNPTIAALRPRGGGGPAAATANRGSSLGPVARPSTPDVLMQKVAIEAVAQDAAVISRKEAINGHAHPRSRNASAPSPLRSGERGAAKVNGRQREPSPVVPQRASSVANPMSEEEEDVKPFGRPDAFTIKMLTGADDADESSSPRPITRSMSNRAMREARLLEDRPPKKSAIAIPTRRRTSSSSASASPHGTPSPPPPSTAISASAQLSAWRRELLLAEAKKARTDASPMMTRTRSGRALSAAS